jgi:hypothetical protein
MMIAVLHCILSNHDKTVVTLPSVDCPVSALLKGHRQVINIDIGFAHRDGPNAFPKPPKHCYYFRDKNIKIMVPLPGR